MHHRHADVAKFPERNGRLLDRARAADVLEGRKRLRILVRNRRHRAKGRLHDAARRCKELRAARGKRHLRRIEGRIGEIRQIEARAADQAREFPDREDDVGILFARGALEELSPGLVLLCRAGHD